MNMSNIDATIQYYNQNAKDFYTDTVSEDMSTLLDRFLSYLEENAYILDFGCGSKGYKILLEKGYLLDAVDGSAEMCRIASRLTGIEVDTCISMSLRKKTSMMAYGHVRPYCMFRMKAWLPYCKSCMKH